MSADLTGQVRGAAATTAWGDRSRGLSIALAGVLLYVVLHVGFRLLASSTLGEDDTLDQILVQDLRWGYSPRQPPLYDWVLYGVQQVTGPRLLSFLVIKYVALTATVVLLYLAAYRVLQDRIWALLTVESLALIYQIAWRYHEGFTHEVLAMVAVAATLYVLLRLVDHGRGRDYVLFGIVSGLGMLTEPNYTVYQLCLWGAVAAQPSIRARVVRPLLFVSAAIAVAIASPFIAWVVSDPDHVRQLWRPSRHGHLKDVLVGVKDAVRGPFMYLAPLIVILPVVLTGFLRTAVADIRAAWPPIAPAEQPPDLERLVMTTMLLGIVVSILGGLAFGIGGYAMHVLMPLYVTSVIWLFGVARRSAGAGSRMRIFARLALAIAVLAFVARMANMFVLDPVCGKCRWGIPYATLATKLREAGFDPAGTIIAPDDELAGNLRSHFPNAAFVLVGRQAYAPLRKAPAGANSVLVWDVGADEQQVRRQAAEQAGVDASPHVTQLLTAPWRHLWKPLGYRTSDWRFVLVPSPRR